MLPTRLLILLLLLAFTVFARADTGLVVWGGSVPRVPVESHVSYYADTPGSAGIDDILALPGDRWQSHAEGPVSLGYVSEPHWFRFRISSASRDPADNPFLEISYPVLDYIDLYTVQQGRVTSRFHLGSRLPFDQRPVDHRNFVVPLDLTAADQTTVYLRVKTATAMQVPLTLWRPAEFHAQNQSQILFEGLYYGIALIMVLYHIFVYVAVGERSFLYYVGYIACMPLFLLSLHGLAFEYLWPRATRWNDQAMMFFLNGVVLFGSLFTIRFLSLRPPQHTRLSRFMMIIVLLSGLLMAASLILPFGRVILPSIALAVVACCSMLVVGVYRLILGDSAARYYTIAWGSMLLGGIILALSKFTVLPRNLFTENATQVGSALGLILLSIALADRLNKEKKATFEAQQQALREERNVRRLREESLRIQQEANAKLESRVKERTAELEVANHQLKLLSARDSLTGLKNRGYFEDALRSECIKSLRYQRPLALLVLDIDHFKLFNDTYGHLVGDECLKMVAGLIKQFATRPGDLAARFGGEEFVVILPETDANGAVAVAERIREKVEASPFHVGSKPVRVTISIGVASRVPEAGEDAQALFKAADDALYQAKSANRNRVVLHQGA